MESFHVVRDGKCHCVTVFRGCNVFAFIIQKCVSDFEGHLYQFKHVSVIVIVADGRAWGSVQVVMIDQVHYAGGLGDIRREDFDPHGLSIQRGCGP